MIQTVTDIRERLNVLWPSLEDIWIFDKKFYIPTMEEVAEVLKESEVPKYTFINEMFDCDDFALQFLAEYRRKWLDNWKKYVESPYPAAVGMIFCDRVRGMDMLHQVNIAFCQDAVYIIDTTPMANRLWKASSQTDNIIMLYM